MGFLGGVLICLLALAGSLFVLRYLPRVYAAASRLKRTANVESLCRAAIEGNRVPILSVHRVKKLSSVQIAELVTVADAARQPYGYLPVGRMLGVNCCGGSGAREKPILAGEQNQPNVRLADDGIAAGVPLLLIDGIQIVGNDKVRIGPHIRRGGAGVI